MAEAIFAAGCFWGIQEDFSRMKGVSDTEVGYTGGHHSDPTYEEVCSGNTGHAEAVRIVYDPNQIDYSRLLDEFFSIHDPTQLNRQGPDIGHQYRSAVFYTSEEQKEMAHKYLNELNESGRFTAPIVTEIKPAKIFYAAEDYHQHYLRKMKT